MTGRLSVGVMGHVDHGKTALVRALTGQDTDRLPEEKRRGISIALGFAHARFGEVEVDFIDMPGHERFVRTLVAGATGVDAALLVVAANEGVKPQTLEHLDVAALLGLRRVLVVVAKADLVSRDTAEATARKAAQAARDAGLEALATPPVSAIDGRGLEALAVAVAGLVQDRPAADDDGFPWLPIDRAFTLAGQGTVVTGTLRRGRLRRDDALALSPDGRPLRVRGLQVHGRGVDAASPGQRVAVNLRGLEPGEAPRGAALAPPDLLTPSSWLSVTLRTPAAAAPLHTGVRLRLLLGTAEVEARLRLLDRDVLEPGETALAQLDCAEPVAAPARERFVLRLASPPRTVGGGVVLDPASRRLRRRDPALLVALQGLDGAAPPRIVAQTLAEAGVAGVSLVRLARLAGVSPPRAAALAQAEGAQFAAGMAFTPAALAQVQVQVRAVMAAQVEAQPNGTPRRRLAALLPGVGAEVLELALARLAAEGAVRLEGAAVRLPPRHADVQAEARQVAALAAQIEARLRQGGLAPPDAAVLAPTPLARRILDRLVREGRAVHTLDRVQKREVYFHPEAVADAKARLRPLLGGRGLTTGEAGAALDTTRKFSVPLLEHLDVARFTRRQGDRRTLGPGAAT